MMTGKEYALKVSSDKNHRLAVRSIDAGSLLNGSPFIASTGRSVSAGSVTRGNRQNVSGF